MSGPKVLSKLSEEQILATAGEAIDNSTDFNCEIWDQQIFFQNDEFNNESNSNDLNPHSTVFSTASTPIAPTKTKGGNSVTNTKKRISKKIDSIFKNICKFSLPKCIPAALQTLLLVFVLTPLAWRSGLNKQIESAGTSKPRAHMFTPHYQANTIEANVITRAPIILNKTYQPHTDLWEPVARRVSPEIFAPANQLKELCITECIQKFLAKTQASKHLNIYQSRANFEKQVTLQATELHLNQKLDTSKPAGQLYRLCIHICVNLNPPTNTPILNANTHHTKQGIKSQKA